MSHQPIQNSVALFRGPRQNTRYHLPQQFSQKHLSASAIAIMSWQDVIRSSLCSGVKECGKKYSHNFLFPNSFFRIRRTTVLGTFKDSAIILDAIRRSLLTNQQQQQYLPQFESILHGHISSHLLLGPFRIEIENTPKNF